MTFILPSPNYGPESYGSCLWHCRDRWQYQAVMEPPRSQDISCLGSCRLQVSKRRFRGEGLVPPGVWV